jgi:hypothetical protein
MINNLFQIVVGDQACIPVPTAILLRLFNYFYQSPAFSFAQGTGFHNANSIAYGALIFLIMSVEFGSFLYELTIDGVLYSSFNRNSDGLFHSVAGNNPNSCFTQISIKHYKKFDNLIIS